MSCPACLNLLRFPVNLGCGHSMCKVCILSSDETERARAELLGHLSAPPRTLRMGLNAKAGADRNVVKVVCRICHASSTFTSEAALVVDSDLQAMVDMVQGTAAATEACMRCGEVEANVSCTECNAKICTDCSDLVHVGTLRNHRVHELRGVAIDPSLQAKPCEVDGHQHYRKELYCADCSAFLCVLCAQTLQTHKSHNVVSATEAAVVERTNLVECVHAADVFKGELRATVGQIDAVSDATKHHSEEEIRVFEDTMNLLIGALSKKRDDLVAEAKQYCDGEVGELRHSRDRIFSLATRLNESVAESNKALRNKSAVAIVQRSKEMEDTIKRWDPIVVPSASCPAFSFPDFKTVLSLLERVSVEPAAITSIEAGLASNHLGRTLQFIRNSGPASGGGGPLAPATSGAVVRPLGQRQGPVMGYSKISFSNDTTTQMTNITNGNASYMRPPPVPPTTSYVRPPAVSSRSLLHEFNTAATPSHYQEQSPVAAPAGPSSTHFLNEHFRSSALQQSPSTNLTHPGGGVLIEPSALLPARQQASQFRFTKSTFGGIVFTNGGRTVRSSKPQAHSWSGAGGKSAFAEATAGRREGGWETAMADTLLTRGRHYFELRIDHYSPQNGHNIVIGLVFDGNYGLCDALGEDNNSVGLDVGMGTKCIGGNYGLPYVAANAIGEGDVVGVDINFEKQTLEFYHNGRYLGVAFTGLSRPCYPAVSFIDDQQVTVMFPLRRPL